MFDSLFPKEWTTLQRLMWLKTNALARAVYETITGNPVSFSAKAAPLKQLQIAFSPVQSGTGDPSPDNVRPISGWSSLTVEQYGKNLINYNACVPGYIDDVTGNVRPQNNAYSTDFIPVYPSTDYAFTLSKTSGNWGAWYDSKKNWISGITFYGATDGVRKSPSNAAYMRMTLNYNNSNPNWQTNTQIEKGSAVTERVPYNGRSISISLGETVYSGYVDVISGVGEVTHVKAVLDGTGTQGAMVDSVESQTIADGTAWVVFLLRLRFAIEPKYGGGSNISCKCNMLKQGSAATSGLHYGEFNTAGSYFHLVLPDQTLDTKAKVNAWLANNPIELCYEIATPIPIQLTPQEVNSLAGDNTMWSDVNGDLTVEYRSN